MIAEPQFEDVSEGVTKSPKQIADKGAMVVTGFRLTVIVCGGVVKVPQTLVSERVIV